MSRTRSQKKFREVERNNKRQEAAKQQRLDVQSELVIAASIAPCRFFEAVRSGRESAIACRKRLHHKRVTYRTDRAGITHKHTRVQALPSHKLPTSSRLESKLKIAARILNTYVKCAKEMDISKKQMLEFFINERPAAALLLEITK